MNAESQPTLRPFEGEVKAECDAESEVCEDSAHPHFEQQIGYSGNRLANGLVIGSKANCLIMNRIAQIPLFSLDTSQYAKYSENSRAAEHLTTCT
jgi:hypothetical protein